MERRNVEARWTVSLKRYCSPTGADTNEQPLPRIQRRASVSTEHRSIKLAEQSLRENYHRKENWKTKNKRKDSKGIFGLVYNSDASNLSYIGSAKRFLNCYD